MDALFGDHAVVDAIFPDLHGQSFPVSNVITAPVRLRNEEVERIRTHVDNRDLRFQGGQGKRRVKIRILECGATPVPVLGNAKTGYI